MALNITETFAPVLLVGRAWRLSQGKVVRVCVSKLEKDRHNNTFLATIEPIVVLLTIYIAILYGTVSHCYSFLITRTTLGNELALPLFFLFFGFFLLPYL